LIVIDASVALSWATASQKTAAADTLLQQVGTDPFIAPSLFAYEIRNALLGLERRGRISSANVDMAVAVLLHQTVRVEAAPDEAVLSATFLIARDQRISFYDAAYLELAVRQRASLASRDEALLAAAAQRAVTTLDVR
jgi:predicted nucleic acid-binding protein